VSTLPTSSVARGGKRYISGFEPSYLIPVMIPPGILHKLCLPFPHRDPCLHEIFYILHTFQRFFPSCPHTYYCLRTFCERNPCLHAISLNSLRNIWKVSFNNFPALLCNLHMLFLSAVTPPQFTIVNPRTKSAGHVKC